MAWAVASAPPASDDHDLTTAARWTTSVTSDLPDTRTDRFPMTTRDASLGSFHGMDLPADRLTSLSEKSSGFVQLDRFRTFATWRSDMSDEHSTPADAAQSTLLSDLSLVFRLRLPGVGCRETPSVNAEKPYWIAPLTTQYSSVALTRPEPFGEPNVLLEPGASRVLCVEPVVRDPLVRDLSIGGNYAEWIRQHGGRGVELRMTTTLHAFPPSTWSTTTEESRHTIHVDLPPARGPEGDELCTKDIWGRPVLRWGWPRAVDYGNYGEHSSPAVDRWELVQRVGDTWTSVEDAATIPGYRRDYTVLRKFVGGPGTTRVFAMRLHPFAEKYTPGAGVYVDSAWTIALTNKDGDYRCGVVEDNPDAGPHGWPR